ncbi:HlyD family efflux transporter periplasmic adaptor subunit [soil metagenome]
MKTLRGVTFCSYLRLACALIVMSVLAACSDKRDDFYSGYVEGDTVRISTPITGTLVKLHLQRGDKVQQNAPAFVLEQESERAAREEASSRVLRAQAVLANLKKGKRPDELAAVQAQLAQAEAAWRLSSADLARQKQLVAAKFISPARLDEARAAVERDQAHVNELRAQTRVAQLGSRSDELEAADQDLKAAQAQLVQAEWKVAQKTQRTPASGDVIDVLYREGELVPAGSPVISLLPPQNIKARFFVPEPAIGNLQLGQDATLQCDGCGAPIAAKISFIARAAEYTSPLIYSKENRSTLVFMLEARASETDAQRLHPGQPLEIRLVKSTTKSAP